MKEKKIVFDGRFLSLKHAGIGRYSCEILKNILPLDKKQRYIILVMKGARLDKELSKAMYERDNPVDIIELDYPHYSWGEQTNLLKLLIELKADLVHFPHFNHPLLYRGKYIVTIHDLTLSSFAERGNFLKRWIYGLMIKDAARRSKKILTVSEFAKKDLARSLKIDKKKIVVTYNGIDESFKKITNPTVLKRAERYGLKNPFILSVGQWRSHKNLLRLVEAFARLQEDEDWKGKIDLVFAGRVDPKYPQLKGKVEQLNLSRSVKFTGFVADEDLPILYNLAEVFVFPSLSEGFGLPGLEAQSCGTPVLSSNRTSLPEVLGQGAIYFDPVSVRDIARKLITVLEDSELRQKLVEEGKKNTQRFSWEGAAKKTLEVYREILYK